MDGWLAKYACFEILNSLKGHKENIIKNVFFNTDCEYVNFTNGFKQQFWFKNPFISFFKIIY